MDIGFFEEYPTRDNLSRLQLVAFPADVYVAARSIAEFVRLRAAIAADFRSVRTVGYWPILALGDGYWISAFSGSNAIARVVQELRSTADPFPVLWDAELPLLNKRLFLTGLPALAANRRLIHRTVRDGAAPHEIVVAQFPKRGLDELLARIAAVAFPFDDYHRLDMLYSSLLTVADRAGYLRRVIGEHSRRYERYSVGLGLIGRGVEDHTTPLITAEELDRDLRIAAEAGVERAVLYRLGGLNEQYAAVVRRYAGSDG